MSIKAMTYVWGLDLQAGNKLVLLALADAADDDGACFPSVRHLTKKCSMGERTVRRNLGELERDGFLVREEREGRSTIYRIALEPLPKWHPCQNGTPAKMAPPPCQNGTHNHKEPKDNISIPRAREKNSTFDLLKRFGVIEQLAHDFIATRNKLKAPITETAMKGFEREAAKAGMSTADAVTVSIERNWRGFKAEWLQNQNGRLQNENDPILIQKRRKAQFANEAYEWAWGDGSLGSRQDDLQGHVIDIRQKVC